MDQRSRQSPHLREFPVLSRLCDVSLTRLLDLGQSGLFLTVITLFIGTSSATLQPDNIKAAVDALHTISQQLPNDTSQVFHAPPMPASPPGSQSKPNSRFDVIENSFLFASLLLCLISSGLGLWVKEWLREYALDLPYSPRDLVHVQQYRQRGLRRWGMGKIVAAMSFLLQLAVALFISGMVLFTLRLNHTLYLMFIGLAGSWLFLVVGTALSPALAVQCPYRSPLSRVLYRLLRPLHLFTHKETSGLRWRTYESMVESERRDATHQGAKLEIDALEYINREFWGHKKLAKVNRCFMDVEPKQAMNSIEGIIAARMTKDRTTFVHRADAMSMPSDPDVLELLCIWGSIQETHELMCPTGQERTNEQLWTAFKARVGETSVLAEVAFNVASAPCRSGDSTRRRSDVTYTLGGGASELADSESESKVGRRDPVSASRA